MQRVLAWASKIKEYGGYALVFIVPRPHHSGAECNSAAKFINWGVEFLPSIMAIQMQI